MAGAHRPSTGGLIHLKRAYHAPEAADEIHYLVDRLWPRSVESRQAGAFMRMEARYSAFNRAHLSSLSAKSP